MKKNKMINEKRYSSLIVFLERNSVGHYSKKFDVFPKLEIEKFLREADDKTYPMIQVIFLI